MTFPRAVLAVVAAGALAAAAGPHTASGLPSAASAQFSPYRAQPTPDPTQPTPDPTPVPEWANEREALVAAANRTTQLEFAGWDWDTGTALHGLMAAWGITGYDPYLDRVRAYLDPYVESGLPVITHPNHVTPGLALLDLYEATGEDRYLSAALRVGEAALSLPRLDGAGLQCFAHAPGQAWVDTLYMTVPFLARLGGITGERAWIDEAVRQYIGHATLLQEPSGAFRHGWERLPDGGGRTIGSLWLRGNAWAAAAGSDLLGELGSDHLGRPQVERTLTLQLAALATLQADSGRWSTVVDHFDYYQETSGTAGVAYAVARSLAQGPLGSDYAMALDRARSAVVSDIAQDGTVMGVSVGTGPLPDPEAYNHMGVGQLQLWGQGLALLALSAPGTGLRLEAAPTTITLAPGDQANIAVRPGAVWGPTGPISLTVGSLDSGLIAELTQGGPGPSGVVALSVLPSAGYGLHGGTVLASASAFSVSLPIQVHVVAAPSHAFVPLVARGTVRPVKQVWPLEWSQPDVGRDGSVVGVGTWGAMLQRPGDVPRTLRSPVYVNPRVANPRHVFGSLDALRSGLTGRATSAAGAFGDHNFLADVGDPGQTTVGRWSSDFFSFPAVQGRWREVFPWEQDGGHSRRHAAPAPDPQTAALITDEGCPPQPCGRLGIADLVSGSVRLSGPASAAGFPDWARNNKIALLQYTGSGTHLVVWDESEEMAYVLASTAEAAGPPRWSPDLEWIAMSEGPGIRFVNLLGSADFFRTAESAAGVSWDPEGRFVVFDALNTGTEASERRSLYQMAARLASADRPFPPKGLERDIAGALDAFVRAHPLADEFASYALPPSVEAARSAAEEACHDWPALPEVFGEGVHPAACRGWVEGYLALFHAVGASRLDPVEPTRADERGVAGATARSPESELFGFDQGAHDAWSQAFLEAGLGTLADFVYGPEARPSAGYRDTRAAVWQNPQRAEHLLLAADLLRRRGRIDPVLEAEALELASAVARAWDATWWSTGVAPSDGVTMTTATSTTLALNGSRIGPAQGHYFEWDADEGNSPAEEAAWLGSGAMLASRIAELRDPVVGNLAPRARHFTEYALAFDAADGVRGQTVRTLNLGDRTQVPLERRYWIENHFASVPSVPYAGSVWDSMTIASMAAPESWRLPWWRAAWGSAEETLRDADGFMIVDLLPGDGAGYALEGHEDWAAPCGSAEPGRAYVDRGSTEAPRFVSEIGHGASTDLLAIGVGVMRHADIVNDGPVYLAWQARTAAVLRETTSHPPDPGWAGCKTAPHVSANRAYHTARIAAGYLVPLLAASGYEVESW